MIDIDLPAATRIEVPPPSKVSLAAPTSPKTGLELIELDEYDGSGIYGRMIINWSQLTQGNEYQLDDWSEGGIFAVNSMSPL